MFKECLQGAPLWSCEVHGFCLDKRKNECCSRIAQLCQAGMSAPVALLTDTHTTHGALLQHFASTSTTCNHLLLWETFFWLKLNGCMAARKRCILWSLAIPHIVIGQLVILPSEGICEEEACSRICDGPHLHEEDKESYLQDKPPYSFVGSSSDPLVSAVCTSCHPELALE